MKENQHLEWKETWRDEFLREAVLNALVHRDYATGAPVQIRVHDDRLRIWNPCVLPDGWTVKTLLGTHPSTPFNPAIANVFFRSGEIETWGRGIERIMAACKDAGTPKPKLSFDGTGITLEFRFSPAYLKAFPSSGTLPFKQDTEQLTEQVAGQVTGQVAGQVAGLLQRLQIGAQSRRELQESQGLVSRENFEQLYLKPALAAALIERTLPDKPNSRLQKYRLTTRGRAWLGQQPL